MSIVVSLVEGEKSTHPLNKTNEHVPRPPVTAHEPDLLRDAPIPRLALQTENLNSLIDRLHRHTPVRRPFATSDRQKSATRANMDHVVPDQSFRARRAGVLHQRPNSAPCTEDVASSYAEIRREVAPDFVEDPADFFLGGLGVVPGDLGGRVGGASDGVALPWEKEDDTAVGGSGVEEAHVTRGIVVREGDVGSGRRLDDGLVFGVIHGKKSVGEGTGSVDNSLRSVLDDGRGAMDKDK